MAEQGDGVVGARQPSHAVRTPHLSSGKPLPAFCWACWRCMATSWVGLNGQCSDTAFECVTLVLKRQVQSPSFMELEDKNENS